MEYLSGRTFIEYISPHFVTKLDECRTKVNVHLWIFRSNIKTESEAEEWLSLFSKFSRTNWIVRSGVSRPVRIVYHKVWSCQHSPLNKTPNSSRCTGCRATVDIKIKKNNKHTRYNDPFLKNEPPLCAIVKISGLHNHKIGTTGSLKLLRPSNEVKEQFMGYFQSGCTPSEAMRLHESKLLVTTNPHESLANASVNPPRRAVYYMYDNWRKENFGNESEPLEKLKQKVALNVFGDAEIRIKEERPWSVLVVTDIMRRVQELNEASEIIFCDSSASCDSGESTITVMLTSTKAGAIPIAVMIHENQTAEGYIAAFSMLHDAFPNCFGKKPWPQAFMTDDSRAEKMALSEVWPNATQLLCQFHVAQAEWHWLQSSNSGVQQADRRGLMKLFQAIMYADSSEQLLAAMDEVKKVEEQYPNFVRRILKFLERKNEWVMLFRQSITTRGNNTNNYSEATIRVLKDIILNRTKAFNVVALVEFCVSVWEQYLCTRLLAYAHEGKAGCALLYDKLSCRMDTYDLSCVERDGDTLFILPSQTSSGVSYTIDSTLGICTCFSGSRGAFCKHQAFVHKHFNLSMPNAPAVSSDDQYSFAQLALGGKCPPPSFFLSLKEEVSAENPHIPPVNISNSGTKSEVDSFETLNASPNSPLLKRCQSDSTDSTDIQPQLESISNDVTKSFRRVIQIATLTTASGSLIHDINKKLNHIQNSAQAIDTLLRIKAALTWQYK